MIRTIARKKEVERARFFMGTDGTMRFTVGDVSREIRKFSASEKLGESTIIRPYVSAMRFSLSSNPTIRCLAIKYDTNNARFNGDESLFEHHCTAKVGEDTGGPTRWWEYTCTTVLHENSYPPWQAGRQASKQAAYKGEARPSKYICAYIFSPSASGTISGKRYPPPNKKESLRPEIKRTIFKYIIERILVYGTPKGQA